MDKNNYADMEKQFSKLETQEKYLRELKKISGENRNDSTPEEALKDTEKRTSVKEESIAAEGLGEDPVSSQNVAASENTVTSGSTFTSYLPKSIPFFSSLKKLGGQISKYLQTVSECMTSDNYRGMNLIISSIHGNGKTSLGKALGGAVIAAKRYSVKDKLLVINSEEFNCRDIAGLYKKYSEGCILIEQSEKISEEAVQILKTLMNIGEKHPVMILEVCTENKDELKGKIADIYGQFANEIEIPVPDDNELAEFAIYYADLSDFDIDKMAVLSLHRIIADRQSYTHHVNFAEIAQYVDKAIEYSGRNLFKKLIFSRARHELERPVLTEHDFESIYKK